MISYEVPEALAPISVKAFLKQKGVSGSLFRCIKQQGSFCLNGRQVHAVGTTLRGGDVISYDLPPRPCQGMEPEPIPLDIRYEDDDLLIVCKPAGMLVHPSPWEARGTLANAVLGYYRQRGLPHAFHSVHRLDRWTSGLLLVAKRPEIQHLLSTMDGQRFHREYLAIAQGVPSPPAGVIDAPIARSPGSIIARMVATDGMEGQRAVTRYRLERELSGLLPGPCSLLRLSLETGRTHQIRVHLSHIGCPLLGDDLYGGGLGAIRRQALHAERLFLRQPITGEAIDIRAGLPEDMESLLQKGR